MAVGSEDRLVVGVVGGGIVRHMALEGVHLLENWGFSKGELWTRG